jgi:general secretion pathway protein G
MNTYRDTQLHANSAKKSGFTIVELLVVIVVIGILAAITIVSYAGISQKAVATSLTSDLDNASRQLKLYQVDHGSYPTYPLTVTGNNYCPSDDAKYCFKASPGNSFTYTNVAPLTFNLRSENSSTSYSLTNNSQPTISNATTTSNTCPTGFIPVPGSGTYGTNDFCVMKYEASQVGATSVPISTTGVMPWVNLTQPTALADSANVAGCTGCHLISEAEYQTIVQNVTSVATNWSGGTVGSGYIYSGHNDDAPSNALAADSSDLNGYAGETNTGGNQRRTLKLTNNQVIWDLAGNVSEWTSDTVGTGQPGVNGGGYAWREWTAVTNPGSVTPNPSPGSTGISGAGAWTSAKGIGTIYSNANETVVMDLERSGYWDDGANAGVFFLYLSDQPWEIGNSSGFRVAR